MSIRFVSVVVAAIALTGCLSVSKRDFDRTSTVNNVQFELTAVGKEDGRYTLCKSAEVETKAREMTAAAFSQVSGQYRVVLERQSDAQLACYEKRFGENLARDATVVGLFMSDIYWPYTTYRLSVFKDGRLVFNELTKEHFRSTKHDLNLNKLNQLADEARELFVTEYQKSLSRAVSASRSAVAQR